MPHQPLPLPGDVPELKVSCNAIVLFPPTWIENNFSSYHKLLLVTSWCLRFVTNGKAAINNRPKLLSSTITTVEIQSTEQQLFRLAQQQAFPAELIRLNQHQLVGSSSPIKALSPFLDKHGLIRVGGRLANAHLTNSQMHPVILSAKSRVTCLLFCAKHLSLGHCGPTLLLLATGAELHVLGAKKLSRCICRSCITCLHAKVQTRPQIMGQLPEQRVTPSPPFSISGIDYAGPFSMKKGSTRRPVIVTTYVAVFVCFSTKAAHLEAVSDATTEAFLVCLKRFVSRRGAPAKIHTDNGGNFKGAKRDLQELYAFLKKTVTISSASQYLLENRIQWHSIPERAPHFGGLW